MALVASPYGMLPVKMTGSRYDSHGVNRYPLISNSSSAFYFGCVVTMAAGVITPVSASPTAGTAAGAALGIFMGCEYDSPELNYRLSNNYLVANAITAGATNVQMFICDDPDAVFQVQSAGNTARTAVGSNMALQTFTGSTTTHKSNTTVIATAATTNTYALRLVGAVDDKWYDATTNPYPDLLVRWNFGAHVYHLPLGQ